MRKITKIMLLLIILLLIGCIKPVKIIVPENMQNIPAMPVVGTENSWRLDFGGFHAYNIQDREGAALITDVKYAYGGIQSFEFIMNSDTGTPYECYCEFPTREVFGGTFRCTFQNTNNQFDLGKLEDTNLKAATGNLQVEGYFKVTGEEKKDMLVGYLFKDSGKIIGLVDISNTSNEKVWIDPLIDPHSQTMVAASSIAQVIKHRKWYEILQPPLEEKSPGRRAWNI